MNRLSRGSVLMADLQTLRSQDILAAVSEVCARSECPWSSDSRSAARGTALSIRLA